MNSGMAKSSLHASSCKEMLYSNTEKKQLTDETCCAYQRLSNFVGIVVYIAVYSMTTSKK